MPPPPAENSSPRLLHLGCGQIAPPEWTNLDGSWNALLGQRKALRAVLGALRLMPKDTAETTWPENIVFHDLRKKLPYPDHTFDGTYSSHTVEHLYRTEALRMLKECYRVTKPGGVCRTLVPDLAHIISEYNRLNALPPDQAPDQHQEPDPGRLVNKRLMLRKEQPWPGSLPVRLYRALYDYRSHKQMYDERSLILLMEEAGFTNCRRRGLHESDLPFIDKVELPVRVNDGGLAVEGRRPM